MSGELVSNWIEIFYIFLTGLVIGYVGLLIRPGSGWAKFAWSNRFQPFTFVISGYFIILVVLPVIFYFIYPTFYVYALSYINYTIPGFFAFIGLYFVLILVYLHANIISRLKFIAIPFLLAFLAYLIVNV